MILCSNPGCQTTAGCVCDRVGCSPKKSLAGAQADSRDATISQLQAEIVRYREALRNMAEGNLGGERWQANYDRICDVARAALGGSHD